MKARYFCIALGALAIAALPAGAQDRDDRDRGDLTSKIDTTVTLSKGGTVDLSLISGEIVVTE